MGNNQSYKTAFGAAYARLIEQYIPKEKRLFDDPYVKYFFGKSIQFPMQFQIIRNLRISMYNLTSKGIWGIQVCRTKYIDDYIKAAIADGIQQLVILGAGLDTRPYRLSCLKEIKVVEVDLPIIQNIKRKKLEKCLDTEQNNVHYISIDFNSQTLEEVLTVKELDFSKPIFFIWEGVTQYITEESVKNTLEFISKTSCGSILVFTYILKSVIDGTSSILGAENIMNYFEMEDQIWNFGLEPSDAGDFLKQFNLTLIQDVGSSYYQENYLKPLGRNLDVSEMERIIYAKKI